MAAKETDAFSAAFMRELLARIPDLVSDVFSVEGEDGVLCFVLGIRTSYVYLVAFDCFESERPLWICMEDSRQRCDIPDTVTLLFYVSKFGNLREVYSVNRKASWREVVLRSSTFTRP